MGLITCHAALLAWCRPAAWFSRCSDHHRGHAIYRIRRPSGSRTELIPALVNFVDAHPEMHLVEASFGGENAWKVVFNNISRGGWADRCTFTITGGGGM